METDTFLSTSVRTLLDRASFTTVINDCTNEYLTDRYSFNWDNVRRLLQDSLDNQEPPEWALRSKSWFVHIVTALAPVFDSAERLCQKAAKSDFTARKQLTDHWKWTFSEDELLKCLQESFGSSPKPTSAVESMLVISAVLERAIGNVLRMKNLPVPFLLRDLLLERTLYDTFGEVPIQFARLIVGMPSALNARNLVWHGFVAPNDITLRIPATLLILLASLGEILNKNKVTLATRKNDLKLAGVEDLPEIATIDEFRSTLSSLPIIPPQFLLYWEAAFERYSTMEYGRCLVLLLPQLEIVLRIGFCFSNDCPRRLLTAVQSSPHTTLDDMLVEKLEGKPNKLCRELGEGLLTALFDLLQRPSGPRVRDKLGHGECDLKEISRNLAAVVISVSVATAARLSRNNCQMPVWDDYKARFHPATFLVKTCEEALDQIQKVNEVVQIASKAIDLQTELNLAESLEKVLTGGDALETARFGLDFQPATLFRPREEIITTVALLRTLRSLCVALGATRSEMEKRYSDFSEGRLRSRQRKTFRRMIQITPSVTKAGVCLVIMAERIRNAVADNPDCFNRYQRCLSQMEKYTEKLASYADGTKNRWEEVKMVTSSFCDTALSFFT